MKRSFVDPLVSENAALGLVAAIYGWRGAYVPAAALSASSVASALYHRDHECCERHLAADFIASSTSFVVTLPYLARCPTPIRYTVIALIIASFWVYCEAQKGEYESRHLLWHRLVTTGQLLVATSYRKDDSAKLHLDGDEQKEVVQR